MFKYFLKPNINLFIEFLKKIKKIDENFVLDMSGD